MVTGTTAVPSSDGEEEEVLLDGYAYIGNKPNHTTAVDFTRNLERIVASFWSAPPTLPSTLYVHSPDMDPAAFAQAPRILRMVEGVRHPLPRRHPLPLPLLHRHGGLRLLHLRRPQPVAVQDHPPLAFHDDAVGLLPRRGRAAVAALVPSPNRPSVFALHVLRSEIGRWASTKVFVRVPQEEFPIEITKNARRLSSHFTSTVITLGGDGGTIWAGSISGEASFSATCFVRILTSDPYRGITFIKGNNGCGCLRFVDLDVWSIITWSNFKMSNSFDDWKNDCMPVHADCIKLKEQMRVEMLEYQLLQRNAKRRLENLWVYQPTSSMLGTNIVYLIARAEFLHPKAYVLAVDMVKRELHGVTEFGTGRELAADIIRVHGSVSQA
uniref:Uncharacterized protein n=1 Tax=Oryza punctata TaxID=4537 RepID=A0A0E0LNV7_ORYPU